MKIKIDLKMILSIIGILGISFSAWMVLAKLVIEKIEKLFRLPLGWMFLFFCFLVVIFSLLYKLSIWASIKLQNTFGRIQAKHELDNVFSNLSRDERLYLYKYVEHQTTLIEFDEHDPVVVSLNTKGLIYPPDRVRIGHVVSYSKHYEDGQSFQILYLAYDYLCKHTELVSKLLVRGRRGHC
ncbi:superinfection exclusion B family protein [Patescibacteria group bacterium]|nr:superinfection exclusion B family protein [Patescibacteria group bacterium]